MPNPVPLERQLEVRGLLMATGAGAGQCGRREPASGGRAGNECLGNLPTKGCHRGFWKRPPSGTQARPSKEERAGRGPPCPQRRPCSSSPAAGSVAPLSPAQRESCHQELSVTFKNCEKRNSREDREEGERKRSVARSRQDKSRGDEEGTKL